MQLREESTAPEDFHPKSPFLPEPAYGAATVAEQLPTLDARVEPVVSSPFLSEYSLGNARTESFETALHRETLEELYDEDFNEALVDLTNELRSVHEDRIGLVSGEAHYDPAEGERFLVSYLLPLQTELEAAIDRMAQEAIPLDTEHLTEAQLDTFLEGFQHEANFSTPVFSDFFKRAFKKIKKAVKKGVKLAKRVGKTLAKLSPIHLILSKLKKLVKPLLRRVLKFALNKIPPMYRPLAKRLARRFLRRLRREDREDMEEGAPDELEVFEDRPTMSDGLATDPGAASWTPEIIGHEYDTIASGFLLHGEDFEADPAVVSYFAGEKDTDSPAPDALDRARERFVAEILALEADQDPGPAVENFVTAILAGLRLGIRIIGRKRVVNFLAKRVARLIRRFVGRRAARPLSRALVDAGLRLANLESPDDAERAAGETLAAAVEETVEGLVAMTPTEAYEDETTLDLYLTDAFQAAARSNFPPGFIRPDLREAPESDGVWALQPADRRGKVYKKYTKPIQVQLTSQIADHVTTFGGQTLKNFLREQLGLSIDTQPVQATMHLYQAIRGTSLSGISKLEPVGGLGSPDRHAWMQFHPLTCEAAGMLMPTKVGLCRKVAPQYLADRTRITVGQRFYFLEIPGARMLQKREDSGVARASEVNITLDFASKEIRVYDFLSEAAANELSASVRSGASPTAVIQAIRRSLATARSVLSGAASRHLGFRRETPAREDFLPTLIPTLKSAGDPLATKLVTFVVTQLAKSLQTTYESFSKEVVRATEDPSDGVTLVFTISGIDEVMSALASGRLIGSPAFTRILKAGLKGSLAVQVRPGFQRA